MLSALTRRTTAAVATTPLNSLLASTLGQATSKAIDEIGKVIPDSAKEGARAVGGLADKLLGHGRASAPGCTSAGEEPRAPIGSRQSVQHVEQVGVDDVALVSKADLLHHPARRVIGG